MRAKRVMKRKVKKCEAPEMKRLAIAQEKLVDEHIIEEKKREEANKIKEAVDDIKSNGGVNKPAFWDFKKRMDGKKKNTASAVRGKDGNIIDESGEIKKAYEDYYRELFILEGPSDEIERVAEETNRMYNEWLTRSDRVAKEKLEGIGVAEIEKIIN